VIGKVPEVCPAAIVKVVPPAALLPLILTYDGNWLVRATLIPPVGAGPFRVTVPVELLLLIVDGLRASPVTTNGLIVNVALLVPPVAVAVIVEAVVLATSGADAVKVADVPPAATVIELGTDTPFVAERLTVSPPVGAGPFRVIVPVLEDPPVTAVGLNEMVGTSAVIVNIPVALPPVVEAVIVELVVEATCPVVTLKLAVVAPATTDTDEGTPAPDVALKLTVKPPLGAGPLIVTVPLELWPANTLDGLNKTELGTNGLIVNGAEALCAPTDALMFATWVLVTKEVEILNVPVLAPAAILTRAGIVALLLSEFKTNCKPPAGARVLIVTVAVDELEPITVDGLRATLETIKGCTVTVLV